MSDDIYFADDPPMEDMRAELLVRLAAAECPDRQTDAEIHMLLTGVHCWQGPGDDWVAQYKDTAGWEELPAYTASLDAALALVAKKMPDWTRSVDATLPSAGIDVVLHPGWPRGSLTASLVDLKDTTGTHASEAIATCIALLRAYPIAMADAASGSTPVMGGEEGVRK